MILLLRITRMRGFFPYITAGLIKLLMSGVNQSRVHVTKAGAWHLHKSIKEIYKFYPFRVGPCGGLRQGYQTPRGYSAARLE